MPLARKPFTLPNAVAGLNAVCVGLLFVIGFASRIVGFRRSRRP